METKQLANEGRTLVPACSISEKDGMVNVRLEMPGVPKEKLEIRIDGNNLEVRGDKVAGGLVAGGLVAGGLVAGGLVAGGLVAGDRKPGDRVDDEPTGRYLVRERPTGSYRKSFTMDETIARDKIEADLADGILNIRLHLKEGAKPRRIEVG